jgi:hypothetical protein
MPYLGHLIGHPSSNRPEFSGVSSTGTAAGIGLSSGHGSSHSSGLLGCLSSKDWAVRRAAADALKACVLLLGPALEPEGCWSLGDPGSLTHRCLDALEGGRFDKVCYTLSACIIFALICAY